MSEAIKTYKATVNCRFGGMYRKAGELFDHPQLASVPSYLEEVSATVNVTNLEEVSATANVTNPQGPHEKSKRKSGGKKTPSIPQSAQVSKSDIGIGTPTPVSGITSSDMIK